MECDDTLVFNLMCDMKKKDIEPIARAKLIKSYMDNHALSERQLAKQLGIGHSTLQDWTRWLNISREEYDQNIQEGHTHLVIYRSLRSGTLSGRKKPVDDALKSCISKMEVFKIRPPYSSETKQLIAKLKKILDVIENQVR